MQTVLVTQTEFLRGEDIFRSARDVHCEPAPPDEKTLTDLVAQRGVRAVIVGVVPYCGPLYEALAKQGGGLIARFGVGHDSIDKALARQHGIIVTNTPGVLDVSVAEYAMWLIGCLSRIINRQEARLRGGEFAGQVGIELCGKTLGVLGFGAIGRRVAAIAHFGFGMKVVACDLVAAPADLVALGVECYTADAEELFRQSDIVSIHLPANPSTLRFINATRLAWLKPSAMLINTARGAILDEAALFDALAKRQLAGAALDVFEKEPYQPIHPDKDLRKLENVVLTPHIASNTCEANARMARAALENARHFFGNRMERLTQVNF